MVWEVEFEDGSKGWMGNYGPFVVPAYPGQTEEYVRERIESWKQGKVRFFRI